MFLRVMMIGSLLGCPVIAQPRSNVVMKRICIGCDQCRDVRDFIHLDCGHSLCALCLEEILQHSIARQNMLMLTCDVCATFWSLNDLLQIADEEQLKEIAKLDGYKEYED